MSVNIFKNPATSGRKKMGKILRSSGLPHRRANDNQLRSKFSQELSAGAARHDRFTCIGNHSDRDEFPLPCRDCTGDRYSLGANRQTVRDIFDIGCRQKQRPICIEQPLLQQIQNMAHRLASRTAEADRIKSSNCISIWKSRSYAIDTPAGRAMQCDPSTRGSPRK